MVYVDIDAEHVQEFNEWYNKEHLPELLSVPGILSAARYEAMKGGQKYLACYELESVAVLQTPAFKNRPRTPWGQKVSPTVIGKNFTRVLGEQIYPEGVEMSDRGMAPVLQIGRMSVPAEVDAELERLVQWGICARLPARCRELSTPAAIGLSRVPAATARSTNLKVRPCPKARSGRSNSNIPRPIRRACGRP